MALIGQIAISMVVNSANFTKGIFGARASMDQLAVSAARVGLGLAAFGAVGAAAIGKVVLAASNLQEQTDRVVNHFGSSSQKIIDFANTLGTAYGLAKHETLAAAATFETFFSNAGYASDAVADLSIHFVKVGTNIARDINMPTAQALVKLKSGLAGEAEAIRELGVSMLEADIKAYAYAKGIAKVGAELTSYEKTKTRAVFLTEKFAKSENNLALTGDKVAGALEAVKGRFENLSAAIGDTLLMIVAPALMEVQLGIQALQTAWTQSADAAIQSSFKSSDGLGFMLAQVFTLRNAVMLIGDAWQVAEIAFKGFEVIVGSGIQHLIGAIRTLNDSYIALANLFPGKKIQSNGKLEEEEQIAGRFVVQQMADLKELQKQPWAYAGVDRAFEEARKKIDVARAKLAAQGKLDVLGIKQGKDPALIAGHGAHQGFAQAATFGSAEATNTILQSMYGMGNRNGAADQTARNTARTNVILEQLVRGRVPGLVPGHILDAF